MNWNKIIDLMLIVCSKNVEKFKETTSEKLKELFNKRKFWNMEFSFERHFMREPTPLFISKNQNTLFRNPLKVKNENEKKTPGS